MSNGSVYDEDYFIRGKQTGKSLYENYRYLPELSIPMCQRIVEHCGIAKGERILDFGCARGYIVKALRGLGYEAYGLDISEWAIENCDPEVKDFVALSVNGPAAFGAKYDWVIAKDVLEHVNYPVLTVNALLEVATKGIFAVVPLSMFDGQPYVVSEYEKDVTHLHRLCLSSWAKMFMRPGWSVEGRYMVPGVKENYQTWQWGNGFLTARRIQVDPVTGE